METILKSIGIGIYIFFTPIIPLFLLIGVTVVLDTSLGIVASKREGKEITSSRFSRILSKSLIYMSLISIFYGMDYILLNQVLLKYLSIPFAFTKIIGLIVILVELFSVDEKIRKINNDKGIKYYVTNLLKYAKILFRKLKDIKSDINEIK